MVLCGGRDHVCLVNALPQCLDSARLYPGKVGSMSLLPSGEERRKLKCAEGVIHSHHLCSQMEIVINSLGEVVVPKLFLFVEEGGA